MTRTRLILVSAAVTAAALLGSGDAGAANVQLRATVGPGFTITLRGADGQPVEDIAPGTYDIVVEDLSDEHNFHLTGPGVNETTTVGETGTKTWTVTFAVGRYRYVCDPHASMMAGAFTVGGGGAAEPAPNPPAPRQPAVAAKRLTASVGPGFTIGLTLNGKRATRVPAGTYTITVRDRSDFHNFHLIGTRLNRRTSVPFVGTQTWKVTLRKGTVRFVCDPHAAQMKGSVKVT